MCATARWSDPHGARRVGAEGGDGGAYPPASASAGRPKPGTPRRRREVAEEAPPLARRVLDAQGRVVVDTDALLRGRTPRGRLPRPAVDSV
jgi:hypothetical protein